MVFQKNLAKTKPSLHWNQWCSHGGGVGRLNLTPFLVANLT